MIEIDGSYGEGGGQILRTSVSLSAITGKPVRIANIRANRSKPGLQRQHLAAVRAAAAICGAELRGDSVGSTQLWFQPLHEPRAGEYAFDIGTAGATTLVAQTVIVPLSLASGPSKVTITGGTHNPMAPTADYLIEVYQTALVKMGYRFQCSYDPAGFNPQGGGRLSASIEPAVARQPVRLVERVDAPSGAVITSSNLPESIADRGEAVLAKLSGMTVRKRCDTGISSGIALTIHTANAGFSSLGERGKPMEKVAQAAVDDYRRWLTSGRTVDEHLADQLVLPSLFAEGESMWTTSRVTEHLRTVLWVAGQFLAFEFELDEEAGRVLMRP